MKNNDKTRTIYAVIGSLLAVFLLILSYTRIFDVFEHNTLDLRYKLRPPQKVNENIVIIEIADDSITKLGEWPFPRNYHALLIKALNSAGAKAIVFDVFFSEKREGDEDFSKALQEADNVYTSYVFDLDFLNPDKRIYHAKGYMAKLIEEIKGKAKGSGFINVVPDPDGKIRRIPAFIEYNNSIYPHLTILLGLNHLGYSFQDINYIPGKELSIEEDFVIPLLSDSTILVNYPDEWGKAFRHYSFIDIIQSYLAEVTGQEPEMDLSELKDAVCFIGFTATASPDAHPSPLEPIYPGVGVHASIFNSMVNKNFLHRVNKWWNLAILIFACFITGLVTFRVRKRFSFASIVLIMVSYSAMALILFWPFGLWVDVFYPLSVIPVVYIICMFKKYVDETQKRELLEKELDIAKDIQQSFLPSDIPKVGNLDISTSMITARQVGGDLYDAIKLDEARMGVMIGDVSGKGVPAALYMARVVSDFKIFSKHNSASGTLRKINEELIEGSTSSLFVTVAFIDIDTSLNKLTISIGGHLPALIVDPDGNVDSLDVEEGLPLGMMESDFLEKTYEYKPGSTIVLYTDGVTEAINMNNEMFGMDKLIDILKSLKGLSSEEVTRTIQEEVAKFAGKAPQHDDITVIAIRT